MSWKRIFKWVGFGVLTLIGLAAIVVAYQLISFSRAVDHVYEVSPPPVTASADSAVIERGRYLAGARGCDGCHGPDFSGTPGESLGPLGVLSPPNLTTGDGGVGGNYTDALFARAIRSGIGADGRTLRFMPSSDFSWMPDEDLAAIASYWRTLPAVDKVSDAVKVGLLGRVLDQFGAVSILSASAIDHDGETEDVPSPEPTARYGSFLARGCIACHGERFSGGRIPGAPPGLPIPANLTSHETGLADWTLDDFVRLLDTGVRPDGRTLDPFMPISSTKAMNETEKTALWEYLRSVEPRGFGNR